MEKRLHYRQQVPFQVRVTAMANPEVSASGETLDISESGVGVCLPIQFTTGTLVQLEIADSTLYGFVAHSREWSPISEPEPSPERSLFRTGIEVVEVLIGTSGLSQLLKANLEEWMPNLQMSDVGQS